MPPKFSTGNEGAQHYHSLRPIAPVLEMNIHPFGLELLYVCVDGIGTQRIPPQVNVISCAESRILHQRVDIAYLVAPKVEHRQAGEIGQRRDIAYLINNKPEQRKIDQVLQRRSGEMWLI